jgi:heme/copper-type cytochrome/quinol oxidase subunit 3
MTQRPALEVSALPQHGFDTRAPLWWGNLFLLMIETTMFGIMVASYFYLRQNFPLWPPPRVTATPFPLNPLPDLLIPTINLIVLIASCAPMLWVDMAARRGDRNRTLIGLIVCIAFGIATIALRLFEFPGIKFHWDENAYGSVVWFTMGIHLAHLLTATLEALVLALWVALRKFDEKHRLDVTVTAVYWYWVAGIWIPLYAIIYFAPRWR